MSRRKMVVSLPRSACWSRPQTTGCRVVQVVCVHEAARYTVGVLMGANDYCAPHFCKPFGALHAEGPSAFVQLFHPGRELLWRNGFFGVSGTR